MLKMAFFGARWVKTTGDLAGIPTRYLNTVEYFPLWPISLLPSRGAFERLIGGAESPLGVL